MTAGNGDRAGRAAGSGEGGKKRFEIREERVLKKKESLMGEQRERRGH